jgi:hypothetical protein
VAGLDLGQNVNGRAQASGVSQNINSLEEGAA